MTTSWPQVSCLRTNSGGQCLDQDAFFLDLVGLASTGHRLLSVLLIKIYFKVNYLKKKMVENQTFSRKCGFFCSCSLSVLYT